MKATSITAHLRPYSIFQKRSTTIAHAFASAIAPAEVLVATRLANALQLLGQNPSADLSCVYCDRPAGTWDHLVGLVNAGEMSGYGHTLGNLVPACREQLETRQPRLAFLVKGIAPRRRRAHPADREVR